MLLSVVGGAEEIYGAGRLFALFDLEQLSLCYLEFPLQLGLLRGDLGQLKIAMAGKQVLEVATCALQEVLRRSQLSYLLR